MEGRSVPDLLGEVVGLAERRDQAELGLEPVGVVFLAFDVEMLFMYPWAIVVGHLGPGAVVEMFGFLLMLLLAVAWARREGAFRWA